MHTTVEVLDFKGSVKRELLIRSILKWTQNPLKCEDMFYFVFNYSTTFPKPQIIPQSKRMAF